MLPRRFHTGPDERDTGPAMSQENVEAVRQVLSGLSPDAAQERTVKSFVERLSPDVEFVEDPRFPEAATYHGREAYLRYAREFVEQFDQFTFAVEGLRDILDGRVLVCLHLHGRGKGSNAAFDVRESEADRLSAKHARASRASTQIFRRHAPTPKMPRDAS